MESRRLPNLILPGAHKSGTTFLAALMAQHPGIFVPEVKEPAHFLAQTRCPVLWPDGTQRQYAYATPEAYRALYSNADPDTPYLLDASTGYFALADVAGAVRAACGTAKVICVLRQPAQRAWSAFLYHRQLGQERARSLEGALIAQAALEMHGTVPQPYLETGFYARHLGHWIALFGADNVHVVLFEDLRSTPQAELDRIFDFLGLPAAMVDVNVERNASAMRPAGWRRAVQLTLRGGVGRMGQRLTRAVLSIEKRRILRERVGKLVAGGKRASQPEQLSAARFREITAVFDEDITELEQLIGRDLAHWKSGAV